MCTRCGLLKGPRKKLPRKKRWTCCTGRHEFILLILVYIGMGSRNMVLSLAPLEHPWILVLFVAHKTRRSCSSTDPKAITAWWRFLQCAQCLAQNVYAVCMYTLSPGLVEIQVRCRSTSSQKEMACWRQPYTDIAVGLMPYCVLHARRGPCMNFVSHELFKDLVDEVVDARLVISAQKAVTVLEGFCGCTQLGGGEVDLVTQTLFV
ncbi:hypothetical protein F5Y19DRAFT_195016 [Xylariaceae sp. FL1651]|nr:hypothetical protein F5Y19DRAFT_195016 [Xylariaceae sp. FL1651]